MKRITMWTTMLALTLGLAGCGTSEPSEDEMFETMATSGQATQGETPEKLKENMKKVGCDKAGEKTYKCMVGRRDGKGIVLPLNFTKSDGKWLLMPGN